MAVIRPSRLDLVSYPYEWSFSQLKEAALLTLDLQSRALDAGMRLQDASAYNVQFDAGRPILMDSLSFEVAAPASRGRPTASSASTSWRRWRSWLIAMPAAASCSATSSTASPRLRLASCPAARA